MKQMQAGSPMREPGQAGQWPVAAFAQGQLRLLSRPAQPVLVAGRLFGRGVTVEQARQQAATQACQASAPTSRESPEILAVTLALAGCPASPEHAAVAASTERARHCRPRERTARRQPAKAMKAEAGRNSLQRLQPAALARQCDCRQRPACESHREACVLVFLLDAADLFFEYLDDRDQAVSRVDLLVFVN